MPDEGLALETSITVEIPDTRFADLLNAARIVCDTWHEMGTHQVTVPKPTASGSGLFAWIFLLFRGRIPFDKKARMTIAVRYLVQTVGRTTK